MWYTHLFSRATGELFDMIGLNREYLEANHAGTFALEHHVRFLAEIRCGEAITIRTRPLGRSAKRLHFMNFMVKSRSDKIAATGEFVGAHIDMRIRRMSAIPPPIADAYDRLLAQAERLPWAAPVCGAMKP
jgi:acyl-CoA thioester hydrolase